MTVAEIVVQHVFIGTFAGLITALGGALKDSPYEGFSPAKVFRSPVVAAIGGLVSLHVTNNIFLIFCFSGYFERFFVEGYKILRAQMPGKFNLHHPSELGKYWGFRKKPEILK